jgi:hypothetical protein
VRAVGHGEEQLVRAAEGRPQRVRVGGVGRDGLGAGERAVVEFGRQSGGLAAERAARGTQGGEAA